MHQSVAIARQQTLVLDVQMLLEGLDEPQAPLILLQAAIEGNDVLKRSRWQDAVHCQEVQFDQQVIHLRNKLQKIRLPEVQKDIAQIEQKN